MEQLKVKIAGEISMSPSPGDAMHKWREVFGISQGELSEHLGISVSTVSDYEGDRRKSPGIGIIKRFVNALFDIDVQKGGELVKRLRESEPEQKFFEAIDFVKALSGPEFAEAINAEVIAGSKRLKSEQIFGCSILDSVKLILEMPYESFVKIYSSTSQRALLFTGTSTGRSPMVAVRIAPIKPALVCLHGLEPNQVDKLAVKIADSQGLPLLVTTYNLEKLKSKLEKFTV